MLKPIASAIAISAFLGLAACDSAEKTGENLDSAVEEATRGEEDLGDGPLERAGESIDEATDSPRTDDAADDVNDATDDNPSTNP